MVFSCEGVEWFGGVEWFEGIPSYRGQQVQDGTRSSVQSVGLSGMRCKRRTFSAVHELIDLADL